MGDVRGQLETIGFGLMAPLFFVSSGLRFDLGALLDAPRGWRSCRSRCWR
jgi:Kef-type K+ transport system membrane component KefB